MIIVIIIVVLALGWLVNEGWKECRVDSDCKSGQYCSSKFECNDIPVIEKTSRQSYISNLGAWVIGISLIVAAIIMKWDTFYGMFGGKKIEKSGKDEYVDLSKSANVEEKGLYQDFLDEKY
jgi:hypothetical protein